MTDQRAPSQAVVGRTRQESPASELHLGNYQPGSALDRPAFSSLSRRRAISDKSSDEAGEQPTSSWLEAEQGEAYQTRARPLRRKANINIEDPSILESSSSDTGAEESNHTHELGRIPENKQSKASRRQRDSTGNFADTNIAADYNRNAGNSLLGNRLARQKHSSLQRRIKKGLSNLPNSSLISVLSGTTQLTTTSNESNSTITQQSYNRKMAAKRKPAKARKRLQAKKDSLGEAIVAPQPDNVFQYMEQTSEPDTVTHEDVRPKSSSSSSSSSAQSVHSEHDEQPYSPVNEPVIESPPTSPMSMPKTNDDDSSDEESEAESDHGTDTKVPYQPSVHDAANDSDEQEDDGEDEEGENQNESEDEHQEPSPPTAPSEGASQTPPPLPQMALERIPPPRVPSSSSPRRSDRHTRRLKRQEQALSEHVLRNPQPQREIHFTGAPSPSYPPTMPLYSPVGMGASPPSFDATAQHTPPVAPQPPQPLPQSTMYYPPIQGPPVLHSPGHENEFAVAARPPPMAPAAVTPHTQNPYAPIHPPHYQVRPMGPDLTQTNIAGYEMVADKLSKQPKGGRAKAAVVPLYRKFESLNHRVLLHLQDEIAEMEEELRVLDECIVQSSPRDHAGHLHPASRRGDARYGGELHYRRTELLGRIYLKLGQYNTALTSFNGVKNLDAAQADDVQVYRTWLEKRSPIDHAETRFLEHSNDLLAVREKRAASVGGGFNPRQSGAIWLPLVLVLPLMVFAIVPGLLGRLVVLSITGAALLKLVTTTNELMEMMTVKEWAFCFSG